jgi:1-phosphofructokinase family hexose kinase
MILIVCPNLAIDETVWVDHFEVGRVHRSRATRRAPGAKGVNVARVLSTLEVPCILTGFVGGSAGKFISAGLQQEGICFRPCVIKNESRTCHILVDEPNSKQTVVNEPGLEIGSEELARFSDSFRAGLEAAELVIFSGSLPPGVPDNFYAELITLTQASGKRALLDCSGAALQKGTDAQPFLLKINHSEASILNPENVETTDAVRLANHLLARNIELVMITLGADGAVLASQHQKLRLLPPEIDTRNSVGSGDAALAGVAAALISGLGFQDLGKLAMAAGSANALHGAGHCTLEEIERLRVQVRCEPIS